MDSKTLKNLEFIGLIFVYLSGTFLKYSCQLLNWEVWTIIFGAVNNSTWEQIKCFTLPYLIWGCIEFCTIKISIKPFIVSKTTGLYAIISLFIFEFAFTSAIIDINSSLIKSFTALLWCALSYYISYKILCSNSEIDDIFTLCIFMLVLFFSMYLSFTINPPHLNIFRDPSFQTYGIPTCPFC